MKLITLISIVGVVLLLSIGCTKNNKTDNQSSTTYEGIENTNEDVQILKVKVDLKNQDKQGANSIISLQEEAKPSLNSASKKAFDINMKKEQALRIDTKTQYPITVMLKDNSIEKYVYNKTQIPKDGSILLGKVNKSGSYELMVDFNEIEAFNFEVFITKN